MASVFLSYDRDDAGAARVIATWFEKAGHSVWWDKHIGGGTEYAREIEKALNSSDVVVVLWTGSSVQSPWVRDEAGSGRDRGRLVPLSLEGTQPPLGFRQFQSIDLGRWRGRGKVPRLDEILAAIERQSKAPGIPEPVETTSGKRRWGGPSLNQWAVIGVAIGMFFVVVGLLIGHPWDQRQRSGGPSVAVVAGDGSPSSQAMAREVLATLGTLQGSSETNFRLLDDQTSERPDLRISVGAVSAAANGRGTVALISPREKAVLWSRQIEQPNGQHGNLEQAVAYAAMSALACAADDPRAAEGLRISEFRAYLSACASSEEGIDAQPLVAAFRRTANAAPKFAPAWANLLLAETTALSDLYEAGESTDAMRSTIRKDVESARKADPDLPEATIAEIEAQPPTAFLASMSMIDKAISEDPDNPVLLSERSRQLLNVGRNEEALRDAERATRLKSYSPALREQYIVQLAASGGVQKAWTELASAKQLWPDASSLAITETILGLHYGDFEKTWRAAGLPIDGGITGYFKIRREPTDANIDAWIGLAKTHQMLHPHRLFILEALGGLKRVDQLYDFLGEWPIDEDLEGLTSVLFQPWTANVRRDPRFMGLAKRVGLLDYWEKSGKWPDFCSEPDMPYDCKKEAAKLKA